MGELDGEMAIVTGAGRLRGIGRAAAQLASLGADVVGTGWTKPKHLTARREGRELARVRILTDDWVGPRVANLRLPHAREKS